VWSIRRTERRAKFYALHTGAQFNTGTSGRDRNLKYYCSISILQVTVILEMISDANSLTAAMPRTYLSERMAKKNEMSSYLSVKHTRNACMFTDTA